MRYLITSFSEKPFFTDYYEFENHFNPDIEMVIYDLISEKYTMDGENWYEIDRDHL
jgi:hypothetical protein